MLKFGKGLDNKEVKILSEFYKGDHQYKKHGEEEKNSQSISAVEKNKILSKWITEYKVTFNKEPLEIALKTVRLSETRALDLYKLLSTSDGTINLKPVIDLLSKLSGKFSTTLSNSMLNTELTVDITKTVLLEDIERYLNSTVFNLKQAIEKNAILKKHINQNERSENE